MYSLRRAQRLAEQRRAREEKAEAAVAEAAKKAAAKKKKQTDAKKKKEGGRKKKREDEDDENNSVVYTLSTEYRTIYTHEGDVSKEKCERRFDTKEEAIAYSPFLIDNFELYEDEYGSIDVDFREDPDGAPNSGLILQVTDGEGSTDKVFLAIEQKAAAGKKEGKKRRKKKTTTKSSGAKYSLRVEEGWSNGWGKSGINEESCDEVFSSVAEALDYAPNLIDNFELFDDEGYGSIQVDFRENPEQAPENGVLLETEDEEGNTTQVIIARTN